MAQTDTEACVVIESRSGHLDPMEVAAYLDGIVDSHVRARLEDHLGACPECRDELVESSRIAARQSAPKITRARVWIPVAAAAVLLLVVRQQSHREQRPEHREAAVTTTVAPRALTPVGLVGSVTTFVWSSVPRADAYRIRVFDADGTVIWDREMSDTLAILPASVSFQPGRAYYWRVEARTGFGRSAATELIEFSTRRARRR